MIKHTPGPWSFIIEGGGIVVDCPSAPVGQQEIAKVAGWSDRHAANAKLIAAAPDLHKALCRVLNVLDPNCSRHYSGRDFGLDLTEAYKALDKAEGR